MCTSIWKEKYCHWLLQHIQHGKNTFTWMLRSCRITLYLLVLFTVSWVWRWQTKRLSPWLTQTAGENLYMMRLSKKKRNVEDVWSLLGGKQHHAHSCLAGFSKKLFVHKLTAVISYLASQSSFVIMGFCIIFRSKAQRLLQCTAQGLFFFHVYQWLKNNNQQLMGLLVVSKLLCYSLILLMLWLKRDSTLRTGLWVNLKEEILKEN